MIGRGPLRVSHVLAVGALTAGFLCAGITTHPSLAFASASVPAPARASDHTVAFDWNGTVSQQQSRAATVGDFLRERNIVVGENDYVDPGSDVPLTDGMLVTYRAAVGVTIVSMKARTSVQSAAPNVAALLNDQGITLAENDEVAPPLFDPVPPNGTVRITRVTTWQRTLRRTIAPAVVRRISTSMDASAVKVISKGSPGERVEIVRYVQRDAGEITRTIVASHVVRKPRPRVVVEGVDELALERLTAQGIARSAELAESALHMVATAYTADCPGCSGMTAIGRPAGHGIVAVDPSVIPLGTRLYIPGYGLAVAGDTGGAIRGNRIDLGFDSWRDAMEFGRREITVYRLK